MHKFANDNSLKPARIYTSDLEQFSLKNRKWQGIPGVCWADTNTLYATWYSGGSDEGPDNFVTVAKSSDGGKSWIEPLVAVQHTDQGIRAFDPAIWTDPQGRVWLFWAQGYSPGAGTIWDGRAGVWASVCENPLAENPKFSTPRRIEDGIMLNKPLVLENGDWLLPVSIWRVEPKHPAVEGKRSAGVVRSTDQGKTFQWLGGALMSETTFDEHHIFEKPGGELAIWARTEDFIGESISEDGGKTWSKMNKTDIECPNSRFFVKKLDTGELLLVNHYKTRDEVTIHHNGREVGKRRNNLTIMLSDKSQTRWNNHTLLESRQSVTYPDSDINSDGKIVLIYDFDRFGKAQINIAIFDLNQLKNGDPITPQTISHLN